MVTYEIPAVPDPPFPLGRRGVHHDPRNMLEQHRALVTPPPKRTRPYKRWFRLRADIFDQQGSSCTFQAAIGVLRTGNSNRRRFTEFDRYDTEVERHAGYLEAQNHDPWPGGEPAYQGSSTDAPFIVLRNHGVISGWKWLRGEAECREYIRWYGPFAVGIYWPEGFFYPDANGFIWPTGRDAGGHALSVVGYDPADKSYELANSWGHRWGKWGRCRMTAAVMAAMLARAGEAVTVA